jgi:hypothetical protein
VQGGGAFDQTRVEQWLSKVKRSELYSGEEEAPRTYSFADFYFDIEQPTEDIPFETPLIGAIELKTAGIELQTALQFERDGVRTSDEFISLLNTNAAMSDDFKNITLAYAHSIESKLRSIAEAKQFDVVEGLDERAYGKKALADLTNPAYFPLYIWALMKSVEVADPYAPSLVPEEVASTELAPSVLE